jgi:hypothetical protein
VYAFGSLVGGERVPDRLFEGEEPVLHLIERIVGTVWVSGS